MSQRTEVKEMDLHKAVADCSVLNAFKWQKGCD